MAKFSNINTSEVLNRLKNKLGIKSDTELSNYLGVTQSLISAWKNRNSIDIDLIITKCKDVDLNWLLLGIERGSLCNEDVLKENKELKNEIAALKNKMNAMKDVIVDLNLSLGDKKRESFKEFKHKDIFASVVK